MKNILIKGVRRAIRIVTYRTKTHVRKCPKVAVESGSVAGKFPRLSFESLNDCILEARISRKQTSPTKTEAEL